MAGSTFPRFRLYENDGTTLVYEFALVLNWDNSPFQDPETFSFHNSLRGQGTIISEGSQESFDFPLDFMLTGDDYEALVAEMNTLPSTIAFNTEYILKIDLTASTTKNLNVKRLSSILFPSGASGKKVVTNQIGIITFLVDSWG